MWNGDNMPARMESKESSKSSWEEKFQRQWQKDDGRGSNNAWHDLQQPSPGDSGMHAAPYQNNPDYHGGTGKQGGGSFNASTTSSSSGGPQNQLQTKGGKKYGKSGAPVSGGDGFSSSGGAGSYDGSAVTSAYPAFGTPAAADTSSEAGGGKKGGATCFASPGVVGGNYGGLTASQGPAGGEQKRSWQSKGDNSANSGWTPAQSSSGGDGSNAYNKGYNNTSQQLQQQGTVPYNQQQQHDYTGGGANASSYAGNPQAQADKSAGATTWSSKHANSKSSYDANAGSASIAYNSKGYNAPTGVENAAYGKQGAKGWDQGKQASSKSSGNWQGPSISNAQMDNQYQNQPQNNYGGCYSNSGPLPTTNESSYNHDQHNQQHNYNNERSSEFPQQQNFSVPSYNAPHGSSMQLQGANDVSYASPPGGTPANYDYAPQTSKQNQVAYSSTGLVQTNSFPPQQNYSSSSQMQLEINKTTSTHKNININSDRSVAPGGASSSSYSGQAMENQEPPGGPASWWSPQQQNLGEQPNGSPSKSQDWWAGSTPGDSRDWWGAKAGGPTAGGGQSTGTPAGPGDGLAYKNIIYNNAAVGGSRGSTAASSAHYKNNPQSAGAPPSATLGNEKYQQLYDQSYSAASEQYPSSWGKNAGAGASNSKGYQYTNKTSSVGNGGKATTDNIYGGNGWKSDGNLGGCVGASYQYNFGFPTGPSQTTNHGNKAGAFPTQKRAGEGGYSQVQQCNATGANADWSGPSVSGTWNDTSNNNNSAYATGGATNSWQEQAARPSWENQDNGQDTKKGKSAPSSSGLLNANAAYTVGGPQDESTMKGAKKPSSGIGGKDQANDWGSTSYGEDANSKMNTFSSGTGTAGGKKGQGNPVAVLGKTGEYHYTSDKNTGYGAPTGTSSGNGSYNNTYNAGMSAAGAQYAAPKSSWNRRASSLPEGVNQNNGLPDAAAYNNQNPSSGGNQAPHAGGSYDQTNAASWAGDSYSNQQNTSANAKGSGAAWTGSTTHDKSYSSTGSGGKANVQNYTAQGQGFSKEATSGKTKGGQDAQSKWANEQSSSWAKDQSSWSRENINNYNGSSNANADYSTSNKGAGGSSKKGNASSAACDYRYKQSKGKVVYAEGERATYSAQNAVMETGFAGRSTAYGEAECGSSIKVHSNTARSVPLWQKNSAAIDVTTKENVREVHAFARGRPPPGALQVPYDNSNFNKSEKTRHSLQGTTSTYYRTPKTVIAPQNALAGPSNSGVGRTYPIPIEPAGVITTTSSTEAFDAQTRRTHNARGEIPSGWNMLQQENSASGSAALSPGEAVAMASNTPVPRHDLTTQSAEVSAALQLSAATTIPLAAGATPVLTMQHQSSGIPPPQATPSPDIVHHSALAAAGATTGQAGGWPGPTTAPPSTVQSTAMVWDPVTGMFIVPGAPTVTPAAGGTAMNVPDQVPGGLHGVSGGGVSSSNESFAVPPWPELLNPWAIQPILGPVDALAPIPGLLSTTVAPLPPFGDGVDTSVDMEQVPPAPDGTPGQEQTPVAFPSQDAPQADTQTATAPGEGSQTQARQQEQIIGQGGEQLRSDSHVTAGYESGLAEIVMDQPSTSGDAALPPINSENAMDEEDALLADKKVLPIKTLEEMQRERYRGLAGPLPPRIPAPAVTASTSTRPAKIDRIFLDAFQPLPAGELDSFSSSASGGFEQKDQLSPVAATLDQQLPAGGQLEATSTPTPNNEPPVFAISDGEITRRADHAVNLFAEVRDRAASAPLPGETEETAFQDESDEMYNIAVTPADTSKQGTAASNDVDDVGLAHLSCKRLVEQQSSASTTASAGDHARLPTSSATRDAYDSGEHRDINGQLHASQSSASFHSLAGSVGTRTGDGRRPSLAELAETHHLQGRASAASVLSLNGDAFHDACSSEGEYADAATASPLHDGAEFSPQLGSVFSGGAANQDLASSTSSRLVLAQSPDSVVSGSPDSRAALRLTPNCVASPTPTPKLTQDQSLSSAGGFLSAAPPPRPVYLTQALGLGRMDNDNEARDASATLDTSSGQVTPAGTADPPREQEGGAVSSSKATKATKKPKKHRNKIDYVGRGSWYSRNGLLAFREGLANKGWLQLTQREKDNMWFTIHVDDLGKMYVQTPNGLYGRREFATPVLNSGGAGFHGSYESGSTPALSWSSQQPSFIGVASAGPGVDVSSAARPGSWGLSVGGKGAPSGGNRSAGTTPICSTNASGGPLSYIGYGGRQNDQSWGSNQRISCGSGAPPSRPRSGAPSAQGSATLQSTGPHSRTPSRSLLDSQKGSGKQRERLVAAVPETQRQVNGILNKLAPERFKKLCETLASLSVKSEGELEIVATEIFEKAVSQGAYCEMYSDMCMVLRSRFPEFPRDDGTSFNFTRALLNRAQQEFGRTSTNSNSEVDKERLLGNMKFIGQLFLRKLLSQRIVRSVVSDLIYAAAEPSALSIECTCVLLKNVGKTLEASSSGKEYLSTFIQRLKELLERKKKATKEALYSKRIKFAIQDVIDLSDNKWLERVVKGAKVKTRGALIQDAQRERELFQSGEQNPYAQQVVAGGRPEYFPDILKRTSSSTVYVEEVKKLLAYYQEDSAMDELISGWRALDMQPDDRAAACHYLIETGFNDFMKCEVVASAIVGLIACGCIEMAQLCSILEPFVAGLEDFILDCPKADLFYHELVACIVCERKTVRLFSSELFSGFDVPDGPPTPANRVNKALRNSGTSGGTSSPDEFRSVDEPGDNSLSEDGKESEEGGQRALHECFYVQLWCNTLRQVQKKAGLAGLRTAIQDTNAQTAAFFFGNFIFEDYRQLHELYTNAGLFRYFDRTPIFDELATLWLQRGGTSDETRSGVLDQNTSQPIFDVQSVLARTSPEEVREDVFLARLVDTVIGVLVLQRGSDIIGGGTVSEVQKLPSSGGSSQSVASIGCGAAGGATSSLSQNRRSRGQQRSGSSTASADSSTSLQVSRQEAAWWREQLDKGCDPLLEHFFQQKRIALLHEQDDGDTPGGESAVNKRGDASSSVPSPGLNSSKSQDTAQALGRIFLDGLLFCLGRVPEMSGADVVGVLRALVARSESASHSVAASTTTLRYLRTQMSTSTQDATALLLQAIDVVLTLSSTVS
ncbi:unnamed protein product [Amoebophrya sp. A25]|nr:unnamed protein product [Amoebophrya sp. A25]|eukprot:GSA25T00002285001.1